MSRQRLIMAALLVILAALLFLAARSNGITARAVCDYAPPDGWTIPNELNVCYVPAQECAAGCWRLVSATYEGPDDSGGNHNIYGQMLDERGNYLVGAPWHVAWPDGNARLLTKQPPEVADFPIFACYLPDQGQWGGYVSYASDEHTTSDHVTGMGLPYCLHVNFRLVWQYVTGCEQCTARAWLPIAGR